MKTARHPTRFVVVPLLLVALSSCDSSGPISSAPPPPGDPNTPPRAVAGPDQAVAIGAVVTLNGLGSADPDGDQLEFEWRIIRSPLSLATLSNPFDAVTNFRAQFGGQYVIHLIARDPSGAADADPVEVEATGSMTNRPPVADAGDLLPES